MLFILKLLEITIIKNVYNYLLFLLHVQKGLKIELCIYVRVRALQF